MTDARFPERWLNDRRIVRLSDADFRSFVVALAWAVSNRTDGRVEADDLPLVPGFSESSMRALTDARLWSLEGEGWQIVDFEGTQSTRAQLDGLDHRRQVDRERQARRRAQHRDPDPEPLSRDESRDVTRDVHRDTKARTGQDRQGQAARASSGEPIDPVTSEVLEREEIHGDDVDFIRRSG